MLARLRNEEDGVAMVLSLMVSFVILLLSTAVVAQSLHTLDTSGYDRRRLQSVSAAEAGIDSFYTYFQTKTLSSMVTDCDSATHQKIVRTATLQSSPATATYTATATFWSKDATTGGLGTQMNCNAFSDNSYPSYALLTSVGQVGSTTPRTMQSAVRLTPIRSGYGGAILSNAGTSLGNHFDVYGQAGNDGDVYVLNGDLVVSNNPTIRGNVYVPNGAATIGNGATITGDLWARDAVTVNTPAVVQGNAYSSTTVNPYSIAGTGTIQGNATTSGAIRPAGSPGLTVGGTRSPGTNPGTTPTQTFPTITYVASDWSDVGYGTVYMASSCADAYTWIRTVWTGASAVLRITSPATACTFANGNNHTIDVKGNLAIISDWGFNLSQMSNWNGSSTKKNLYFISTSPAGSCPASNLSTTKNITVGNNTNFNTFVNVFFYTPCTATVSNQNNFSGQVIATNVSISNNFTMTYYPVLVPGVGSISGFKQDIAYVREVA
jgi:hypothetical protein